MSAKNMDNHNRFRSRQVAFRLSPEEADLLDTYVKLSGLTKQEYITRRILDKDVIVRGNPRVFKALRSNMEAILAELKRIDSGSDMEYELIDNIEFIIQLMYGMQGDYDD